MIVLLIPVILIIVYFAGAFIIFTKAFGRGKEHSIDTVSLTGTPYEPYLDILLPCADSMKKLDKESETVHIKSFDGTVLTGHYYNNNSDKTVICYHGYRATYLNNFMVTGLAFWKNKYNLLIPEQRGHGASGGKYITLGYFEHRDLQKWIDFTRTRYAPKTLVLYGVSMGCHSIARLADKLSRDVVSAMVLDCGYSNSYNEIKSMLKKELHVTVPFLRATLNLFAKVLGNFDLKSGDTRLSLAKTEIPAFFIHGTNDLVVPFEEGKENYLMCASDKDCYWVEGAGHAVGFLAGGKDLEEKLFAFLDNCRISEIRRRFHG